MLHYSLESFIHFRSDTPDGIRAIYLNTVLRRLGLSIIGVFFPVFLFLRTQDVFGESITVGLYGVIAYTFAVQFIKLLITLPTAKYLVKHGFRKTISVGNIFLIGLLILLIFAENYYSVLFLAVFFHAFSVSFYWVSYHTLFAGDGLVEKLGKEVSATKLIERFSGIAGPAIGGLALTIWGFTALYGIALVIVLISIIPFFFMHSHRHDETIELKDVTDWFRERTHKNELVSAMGRQIDDKISAIFFPIFVFLLLGTFAKQGLVEAFALALGSVSIFLAGYYFDKKRMRRLFSFGVWSTAVLTVVRGSINSFGQLIVLDSLRKITSPLYWVTFDSLWYVKSRSSEERVLVFTVINQILASVGTFIVMAFALAIVSFEWRFWGLWVLQAFGVILASQLWKKGAKYEK